MHVWRDTNRTLKRQLAIAAVSITASVAMFHREIAVALVTRGDEFLMRADLTQASKFYDRALSFDAASADAADRLAFAAHQIRTHEALLSSITATTSALESSSRDPRLFYDRGVCYRDLGMFAEAVSDFATAAKLTRDPRMFQLAGWAAYHAGNNHEAASFWRDALLIDPKFVLARRALVRLRLRR